MLGHYSAGFTLDTYAHVTTSMQVNTFIIHKLCVFCKPAKESSLQKRTANFMQLLHILGQKNLFLLEFIKATGIQVSAIPAYIPYKKIFFCHTVISMKKKEALTMKAKAFTA